MQPLEGITVVTLEHAIAAPFATRQLADLGARVIKIERPGVGDFARGYDDARARPRVALRLDQPLQGKPHARRQASRGAEDPQAPDPGAGRRRRAEPRARRRRAARALPTRRSAAQQARADRVRHLRLRRRRPVPRQEGLRPADPERGRLRVGHRHRGRSRPRPAPSIADIAAGMYAYTSILAALLQREQTGRGQHIDISMLESLVEWMGYPLYYAFDGRPAAAHRRQPRHHLPLRAVPGRRRQDRDARPAERARVGGCSATRCCGQPELATDARFAGNAQRVAAARGAAPLIVETFATLTAEQVVSGSTTRRSPTRRCDDMHEVWEHPQLAARGRWREVDTPAGRVPALLPPAHGTTRRRAWTRCPRSASTPTPSSPGWATRRSDRRAARRPGDLSTPLRERATMPATIIDSAIFRDIFSTPEMRQVWSDENRTQQVPRHRGRARRACRRRLGIIPQEAADEIVRHCRIDQIDLAKLQAADRAHRLSDPRRGSQLNRRCAATSSASAATGARPRRTSPTPPRCCRSARRSNWSKPTWRRSPRRSPSFARAIATTPMSGRSNLQQAVPRDLRLQDGRRCSSAIAAPPRATGAAAPARAGRRVRRRGGTLASLGTDGHGTQAGADGRARPRPAGDRLAHDARPHRRGRRFLGLVAGTLGKIRMDVKLMMQTEVAEVYEPFHAGRGSSSTMPQKRNPISCLLHPRDGRGGAPARRRAARRRWSPTTSARTGPWEIEWIVAARGLLPDVRRAEADHASCSKASRSMPLAMRANLDLTRGMVCREAVMMGLGPRTRPRVRARPRLRHLPRGRRDRRAAGRPAAAHPEIAKHLDRAELAKMCDPANYLGLAGEMVDRVLSRIDRR